MVRQVGQDGVVNLAGLSSDTKPTESIKTGSLFYEVDTKNTYIFNEDTTEDKWELLDSNLHYMLYNIY